MTLSATPGRLREPADLDDLLNYRLWRLLALASAPVIRLCEGGHGITRREWRLVGVLARDGAQSPSALAERAHLDRARVSRAIASLAAKRLLVRVGQPGDRRRAEVALTEAGRALYAALFPQIAALNRRVVEVLDDAEAQAFEHALERLTARAAALAGAEADAGEAPRADRRHGGSRRHWPAEPRDAADRGRDRSDDADEPTS